MPRTCHMTGQAFFTSFLRASTCFSASITTLTKNNILFAHAITCTANTISMAETIKPQTACRLLTLPAELRIMIYELVFARTGPEPQLSNAYIYTPQKELMLTCKAVYYDAAQVYARAHRGYFANTKFRVSPAMCKLPWQTILNHLGDVNIGRISEIIISPPAMLPAAPSIERKIGLYHDKDPNGGWDVKIGRRIVNEDPRAGFTWAWRIQEACQNVREHKAVVESGGMGLKRKMLLTVLSFCGC